MSIAVLAARLGDQSPLELHCLGGFVVAMCYDVQRATGDIDVFEVILVRPSRFFSMLQGGVGLSRESDGVYIDAGSRVATVPQNYGASRAFP